MRRGIATLLASILLGLPGGAGLPLVDSFVVYAKSQGHFELGIPEAGIGELPTGQGPINHRRLTWEANDCHRDLRLRLDYEPANQTVGGGGLSVVLGYHFEVRLSNATTGQALPNGTLTWLTPGTQSYLLEEPGLHHADLFFRRGVDVSHNLTIQGWRDPGAECSWQGLLFINEIEANPAGPDAGHEWVEIYNAGFNGADLGNWTLQTHHGDLETHRFPLGTTLPSLSYLVVNFASQFIDNEDDSLSLVAPRGWEVDRTPVLNDTANDGRTWQRSPSGAETWAFSTGTPSAANGGDGADQAGPGRGNRGKGLGRERGRE